MKVLIDFNERDFQEKINELIEFNENLPEEESFLLEEGVSFENTDDSICTYSRGVKPFEFDTETDFMCAVNDGDAYFFWLGHKPEVYYEVYTVSY